jgi:hypothetical protein
VHPAIKAFHSLTIICVRAAHSTIGGFSTNIGLNSLMHALLQPLF